MKLYLFNIEFFLKYKCLCMYYIVCKLEVLSASCNADLLAVLLAINSLPIFKIRSNLALPILVIYCFLFLWLWAVQEICIQYNSENIFLKAILQVYRQLQTPVLHSFSLPNSSDCQNGKVAGVQW